PLAQLLSEAEHTITIETAGTIHRTLPCDLMSISPKLRNSTPPPASGWSERHESTRCNLGALAHLIHTYNCQLKFVLQSPEEAAEVEELLAQLPPVTPERVLIMAEGITTEVQHERQKALLPMCIERGWRMSPRLHIDLFGNTRGT